MEICICSWDLDLIHRTNFLLIWIIVLTTSFCSRRFKFCSLILNPYFHITHPVNFVLYKFFHIQWDIFAFIDSLFLRLRTCFVMVLLIQLMESSFGIIHCRSSELHQAGTTFIFFSIVLVIFIASVKFISFASIAGLRWLMLMIYIMLVPIYKLSLVQ